MLQVLECTSQLDDVLAPDGQMLMVTVAENDPKGL
jgi:hypothetical protein